jgi:hypothetical protein
MHNEFADVSFFVVLLPKDEKSAWDHILTIKIPVLVLIASSFSMGDQ